MKRKAISKQARVAKQAMQVARLAPVVASARLFKAAANPGKSSMQDMNRMSAEKATVFTASTIGMMFAGAAAMTKSMLVMSSVWSPWGGTVRQRLARIQSVASNASADVANAGLAPIRKRVLANSKRLGR
jgi:hypothetical protein